MSASEAQASGPVYTEQESIEGPYVNILSTDRVCFKARIEGAFKSQVIKDMVSLDNLEEVIPLILEDPELGINTRCADILQYVVKYMNYHATVPESVIEKPMQQPFESYLKNDFDREFFDFKDTELIMKILLLSHYLQFDSLQGLLCAKIASVIKGNTPEKIREIFHITENNPRDSARADVRAEPSIIARVHEE
jgi:S-phase kinase-associated protein 1